MRQLKLVGKSWPFALGAIGATVRLGRKWAAVAPGEEVALWSCDRPHGGDCPEANGDHVGPEARCRAEGRAVVVGHWVGGLAAVPAGLVAATPAGSREALREALDRAYGALPPDAEVTALVLVRVAV